MTHVQSLVFHPKTKQKIENHWETLSPAAKKLILALDKRAEGYQQKAVERAIENDPNQPSIFKEAITHKTAQAKGRALEKIENISDDEALAEIDASLDEL